MLRQIGIVSQDSYRPLLIRLSRAEEGTWGQIEVAPKQQTRELSTTLLPFKLIWALIAERLMEALPVIEHLVYSAIA